MMTCHPRTIKINSYCLSPTQLGERVRVRGHLANILLYYPRTAALRHPVFSDLCRAERDSILSPQGERNIAEFMS
jgi:hypothetical protein